MQRPQREIAPRMGEREGVEQNEEPRASGESLRRRRGGDRDLADFEQLELEGAATHGDVSDVAVDQYGLPLMGKELGEPVIEVENVQKSYELEGGERVPALRDVELSMKSEYYPVRRGEFVMIRGPSGGGKTSLLNILGTIDAPTAGTLRLFDVEVDFSAATEDFLADLRLRSIGFVFQSFNLLATLSAYENVELPMTILGELSASERRTRTKNLLAGVGLEDRMNHLPSEMSGGEQQRTTVARALANAPKLLLLDEPCGDLDTRTTVEIMDLLLRINVERNITMVMVTHNPDLECYADRILYVSDGCFVGQELNARQVPLQVDAYAEYLSAAAGAEESRAQPRDPDEDPVPAAAGERDAGIAGPSGT